MNPAMLLTPKSEVSYLVEDCSVRQGIEKFKAHGFSAVPLVSRDGVYLGTIRDKDFLSYILKTGELDLKQMEDIPITELVFEGFNPAVSIDAEMELLFHEVTERNFIPVVDSRQRFVGIITRKAVLNYAFKQLKKLTAADNKEDKD